MEEAEGSRGPYTSASSPSPSSSREGGLSCCRRALRGFRLDRWVLLLLVAGWFVPPALGFTDGGGGGGAGRSLLGSRGTQGNVSFHCSPSGPCLPCQYSEKNDEKYRCSETGYRIPLKCVEVKDEAKETSGKRSLRRLFSISGKYEFNSLQQLRSSLRHRKQRKLSDDSSESQGGQQSYITYRSCLPVEAEEKLSVIGFEMIMVCLLLVSGPIVYMRQRRNIPLPGIGAVRMATR